MATVSSSTVTSVTTLPSLPQTSISPTSSFPPHVHLSSPSDALYAQTLLHLANSLALVPHPSDERIGRLVTLCPRLPSVGTLPGTTSASSSQAHGRTPQSKHNLSVLITTPGSSSSAASTGSASSGPQPSPLFPAVTLTSAWSMLEKTLFSHHTYGSSAHDLLQSVNGGPAPHIGVDAVSNGDGSHGPVGIGATPFTAADQQSEEIKANGAAQPTAAIELSDKSAFAPHAPLDDRSQAALLALLRYVLQAHQSPHLPSLLPLLLRYLLSLPYFAWHTRPIVAASSTSKERKDASLHHLFLSSHPASPFASDLLTLLLHLSRATSSVAINTALLILLRHLILLHVNTSHFLHPLSQLSSQDRVFLTTSNYVLQGLLFALGEQSLVLERFSGRELFTLLLALLKSGPSPLFHALTLRALVVLLSSAAFLFDSEGLTSSLNPHIQSSSLTSYKRLTSPSSSSQHYSTLILTHSLTLSLLCALHAPSLKPTTLAVYKETLDLCLNSKTDDEGTKVMVGCADVCECIMRGMISLAAVYADLIPVIIDTCRSILVTSRRLASHPKQRQLRALFTGAIGSIFLQELGAVPYASSLTRSFIQSSLSSVIKEDEARESEGYQRQLVLLLDVVAMLRNEEVSGQVIGLVLQRFSGRSRYLHLIIPQLTDIAMQLESNKEVDSIVTLFINTYLNRSSVPALPQSISSSSSLHAYARVSSNDSLPVPQFSSMPPTFSHSNIASLHRNSVQASGGANDVSYRLNTEAIAIALTRMAQGLPDEDKRVQMMRRIMRLFSDLAYAAMHEQAKAQAAASAGITNVEACGALLPTLASLLCPEFYQQHGSSVPNVVSAASSTSSLVLAGAFPQLQPTRPELSSKVMPVSLLAPSLHGHPMPYLRASSGSSQGLVGVRIYSSRESNVKWFRRTWYILTHFDFVNSRQVKPEWTAAVRAIAAHSPVLLIDNKRDYLTTELELEAQRFPVLTPVSPAVMQRYLASLLPSLAADVHLFTLPQLLYLASVYHLETLRVRSDSQHGFAPIFAYIADEDINHSGMGHAVSVLADAVFNLFVESVTGKDRDTVKTREDIERHAMYLLAKTCSRFTSERSAASSMLKRLVTRFPTVQWSSSCLTTLLTLFHRLNDSIDTETALSPSASLSLPFSLSSAAGSTSELELPESLSLRQEVRNELAYIANDWLNNAHYLVPQETLTVIQSYIQSSSSSPASLLSSSTAAMGPHAGISLTLKGGQFSQDIETGLSTLVATLGRKEQFLGEVKGIWLQWQQTQKRAEKGGDSMPGSTTIEGEGYGAEFSKYLITQGNDLLSEYRSLTCAECHPPSSTTPLPALFASICQRVDNLILHTAALLVFSTLEPAISVPVQDLLHLTCKLPAQLFISSALSSSVFAWDWILSASRAMELPLLIEMKAAWGYTVDRQIGLFSGKRAMREGGKAGAQGYAALSSFVCEKHPHVHCEPYTESASSAEYDAIAPHIIWTRFLTVHFRYLQSFSRDIVNLVASMLHKAFARSELLAASPSSFGARFRLLNLGFILIQRGALEYRDKQLLRDRVYSVAFSWFYSRPGWYDVGSVTALKEDVGVIREVRVALQNEDKYWRNASEVAFPGPVNAATMSHTIYYPTTVNDHLLVAGEDRLTRLSRHRDLLLFLLAHEVDRIVVWHNPGQLTGLQFPEQHLHQLPSRSTSAAEWKQHTQTAWDIAPILSIRLAQRFSSQEAITSTLRALVKAQPEAVYDISDAVMYLVTEENVRAGAAELRNLVYWSPTSLTNALLMFNPPYSHHRMVMEYAVHTLYCMPEVDTRVLTNHGFLFLEEIERLLSIGEEVLYASFKRSAAGTTMEEDGMRGELVYRRGDLVIVPEHALPEKLLCFNSSKEEQRLTDDDEPYADVEDDDEDVDEDQSPNLSLRVTFDHRMYGQRGRMTRDGVKFRPRRTRREREGGDSIASPPSLVSASQLLPKCGCGHSREAIRMLACADAGRTPIAEEAAFVRERVQRRLQLSDEQFPHFLDFFGFWVGHGRLQYNTGGRRCNAVRCSRMEEADVAFLQAKVPLMGLQDHEVRWRTDRLPRRDGQAKVVTTLLIVSPRWCDFFHEEYGVKQRASRSHDREAAMAPHVLDWDPKAADTSIDELRRGDLPDEADHSIRSDKWLPHWVMSGLKPQEVGRVIEGLWRADGGWKSQQKRICTADVRLREQLVQLLLHAGFSPCARVRYQAGATRAYTWHNQSEDSTVYSLKHVHSLSKEERASYHPLTAMADGWAVEWATPTTSAGKSSCWPTIVCQRDVTEQEYDRGRDGRIWCVSLLDVADEERILVAQRAVRDHRGVVTRQSRPILTGNCHPVDQVVFYLAQIVQSLRNDHFHLLYDFLLRSSHFSILLSHQLIWLCQAELGEVKETGKPLEMTPFRRTCQSLLDQIIANFTPAERSYYRDEFAFFEQVTAISGILKPLPSKQERKQKIKSELEKIDVKKGLYLPTNPHLQVREIVCKSGTPMQSAAKVPILVAFMVTEGELEEDWIRDGGREEEIRKTRHAAAAKERFDHAHAGEDDSKVQRSDADKEDHKNVQVTRLYPVALTAEEQKEQERAAVTRHASESSLSRHISPSSNADDPPEEDAIIVTSPHQPTPALPPAFPQACIFKVGDDCRQDALALQIIQWCKTIFQLHQLPLFLYPYRVLPNRTGEDGIIGGIIECFPEVDTRILTDHGFLFLDEVEALVAADEPVLYACFERRKEEPTSTEDVMRAQLVYCPGELRLPYEGGAAVPDLLEFTSGRESQRWTEDSGPYGSEELPQVDADAVEDDVEVVEGSRVYSRHVSLRVTANHKMYAQVGNARQRGKRGSAGWTRVGNEGICQEPLVRRASELLVDPCSCAEEGDDDCKCSRQSMRMLACAADGRQPLPEEQAWLTTKVQQRLGLTAAQLLPFVELLGFFIGDGSMQYRHAGSGYDAVAFAQVKPDDVTFLEGAVHDVGLRVSERHFDAYTMRRADGTKFEYTVLLITKPSWFLFFDEEFGVKYKHSQYYNPLATAAKQRATRISLSATTSTAPSSPPSSGSRATSSACDCCSASAEMDIDNATRASVKQPPPTPASITRSLASTPSRGSSAHSSADMMDLTGEDSEEEEVKEGATLTLTRLRAASASSSLDSAPSPLARRSGRRTSAPQRFGAYTSAAEVARCMGEETVKADAPPSPFEEEPSTPAEPPTEQTPPEDDDPDDPEGPIKSVKWLPWWVIRCLTTFELRRLIRGLWRADGQWKGTRKDGRKGAASQEGEHKRIYTSGPAFRDQLMHALLLCGYSPTTRLMYKAGTVRGYMKRDHRLDKTVYTVKQIQALSRAQQAMYRRITATADHWTVDFAEPTTHPGKGSCWPSMRRRECITRTAYNRARDGRIWCVTVEHPEHLIVAQRAYRHRGLVTKQSRPIVVGQCVPNAQTRDEIGKVTGSSLKSYFLSKYGREESSSYQAAQRAFIVSEAAYAITSYILQVKDRHNGNLMFDGDGHVIHIDFGFIFSISPAGNLNFEKPAFKLTAEMVELMGESTDSPLYRWFQVLVVRGFLAVREHLHEIIAIVQPMLQSTLTCFDGDSLAKLRARFFPNKSEAEAAEAMLELIYKANGAFRTNMYDWIQNFQQGVYYHKNNHADE